MYLMTGGARTSVHPWYFDAHTYIKAPPISRRAEVDEEDGVLQVGSLVFDVRINLEISPLLVEKCRSRASAFDRGDVNIVEGWIRVPSEVIGIVLTRLSSEFKLGRNCDVDARSALRSEKSLFVVVGLMS